MAFDFNKRQQSFSRQIEKERSAEAASPNTPPMPSLGDGFEGRSSRIVDNDAKALNGSQNLPKSSPKSDDRPDASLNVAANAYSKEGESLKEDDSLAKKDHSFANAFPSTSSNTLDNENFTNQQENPNLMQSKDEPSPLAENSQQKVDAPLGHEEETTTFREDDMAQNPPYHEDSLNSPAKEGPVYLVGTYNQKIPKSKDDASDEPPVYVIGPKKPIESETANTYSTPPVYVIGPKKDAVKEDLKQHPADDELPRYVIGPQKPLDQGDKAKDGPPLYFVGTAAGRTQVLDDPNDQAEDDKKDSVPLYGTEQKTFDSSQDGPNLKPDHEDHLSFPQEQEQSAPLYISPGAPLPELEKAPNEALFAAPEPVDTSKEHADLKNTAGSSDADTLNENLGTLDLKSDETSGKTNEAVKAEPDNKTAAGASLNTPAPAPAAAAANTDRVLGTEPAPNYDALAAERLANKESNLFKYNELEKVSIAVSLYLVLRQLFACFFSHTTLCVLAPNLASRLGPGALSCFPIPMFLTGLIAGSVGSLAAHVVSFELSTGIGVLVFILLDGLTSFRGLSSVLELISKKRSDPIIDVAAVIFPVILFMLILNASFILNPHFETIVALAFASMIGAAMSITLLLSMEHDPINSFGTITAKGYIFALGISIIPSCIVLTPWCAASALGTALLIRLLFGEYLYRHNQRASRSYIYALKYLIMLGIMLDLVCLGKFGSITNGLTVPFLDDFMQNL